MNKTEARQYIEEVLGEIIGDILPVVARIFSPSSGNQQGQTRSFSNEDQARKWAKDYRDSVRTKIGEREFDHVFPQGMDLHISCQP